MIRLLGVLLIFGSSGVCAVQTIRQKRLQLQTLEELLYALHRLEQEIRCEGRALGEIFLLLAEETNGQTGSFFERLHCCRKEASEELLFRQWESAASVPDLNRILQLSELFGVSTDYLLKDSAEAPVPADLPDDGVLKITAEEANDFINRSVRSAKQIAVGAAACILSPVLLIWLSSLAEQEGAVSEEIAAGAGIVALLLIVAGAVALFILSGFRMEEYRYITEGIIELAYGVEGIVRERKARFRPIYRVSIIVGVMLCIFSPIPLITVAILGASEMTVITCVIILLAMVAVAVYLFVSCGVTDSAFDRLLQIGDYAVPKKKKVRMSEWFDSAYWCGITAFYFFISFATGRWGMTWIIFIAAAGLYSLLEAYINRK